jgi:hypothetical protein
LKAQEIGQEDTLKDKVKLFRKEILIKKANLNNEEADIFLNILDSYNKDIRNLMKARRKLINDIDNNPESSDINTKLDKLIQLEYDIADQRKNMFNDLRTKFTPVQIARVLTEHKRFMSRLKDEIKEKKRR